MLDALLQKQSGRINEKAFREAGDTAVVKALELQNEAGVDIVTTGNSGGTISIRSSRRRDGRKALQPGRTVGSRGKQSGIRTAASGAGRSGLRDPQSSGDRPISRSKPLTLDDFSFSNTTRISRSRLRFRGLICLLVHVGEKA